MKRWIYTYEELSGDPARIEQTLLSQTDDLLRLVAAAPAGEEPAGDGSFLLELNSHLASADLAKQIRITTGVARRDGHRVVLPVQWHAEPAHWLFPAFEGGLEWAPLSGDLGQLTLSGGYTIPLGLAGALADATVLRGVAHRTAQQLLRRLVQEIERVQGHDDATNAAVVAPSTAVAGGPLHVRDVMTADPLMLDESMPLRTAAKILFSAETGGAPVVAADGALVGVLSESDLLFMEADKSALVDLGRHGATTVGDACSRPARVTAPDATLSAAAQVMLTEDVSRLVVVGGARVVGLLSRHDVLAAMIRSDRELLTAVRAQLNAAGARDIQATVEYGAVQLHGNTRLRSTAWSLRRRVERIDGVASVTTDDVRWDTDDIIPALTMARIHT